MCDSEKAKLARGYLDRSSSGKVPAEALLLWLDTRGTTAEELCYLKHEENEEGAEVLNKRFVVTLQDRVGPYFRYSDGLALLDNSRSARTIFTLHSDVLEQREVRDGNGLYYYRRNGGRLVRQLDIDIAGSGDVARIMCCVVAAYGADDPECEVKVTRAMIVYSRVLKYEEIVDVESYLSERWKVKLGDVPEDEARLDAKRVDFLTTFDVKAKVLLKKSSPYLTLTPYYFVS